MDALRTQVVETQKARSDLMKWKLMLVAGLGTVGLGLDAGKVGPWHPVLCLVPFVCVYVDALCAHLSLRIRAIGDFLAAERPQTPEEEREHYYELFLRSDKPPFRLETLALHWSTILLSALVAASGLQPPASAGALPSAHITVALVLSGALGIILTLGVWGFHGTRVRAIKRAAEKWQKRMVDAEQSPPAYPEGRAGAPSGSAEA